MHILGRRLIWAVPIGLACLLTGCGSGSTTLNGNSSHVSGSAAYVKTINAYLDRLTSINLDAKVGGTLVAKNLVYGNATPSYVEVGPGVSRTIQFVSVAGPSLSVKTEQTFAKGQSYTIVATYASSGLKADVVNDDLTAPPSVDVKLRVIHEADQAGPVDIYITSPGVKIDDPNNPVKPSISNLAVGAVSAYLEIPASSYRIRATAAGDPSNVIIDTGTMGTLLAVGDIYTAVTLDPHACLPYPVCNLMTPYSILLTQDQP